MNEYTLHRLSEERLGRLRHDADRIRTLSSLRRPTRNAARPKPLVSPVSPQACCA